MAGYFAALALALVAGLAVGDGGGSASSNARLLRQPAGAVAGILGLPGAMAPVDDALAKATHAAKLAWALAKEVEAGAKENVKISPLVKAQIAAAQAAAETAKAQDEKVTKAVEEAQVVADKAALEAAQEYYKEVQKAGAEGIAALGGMKKQQAMAAEVAAAKAAMSAAMPYHAQLLRGQAVIVDYTKHSSALAAAATNLEAEGKDMAAAAQQYQSMGQPVQANQMMMQAHAIYGQGIAMQREAERLHATAMETHAALPAYQLSEQAAIDYGAKSANPPELGGDRYPY